MMEHGDGAKLFKTSVSRRAVLKGVATAATGGVLGLTVSQQAHAKDADWKALTLTTLGTRLDQFVLVIKTGEDDLRGYQWFPGLDGSKLTASVEFQNPRGSKTLTHAVTAGNDGFRRGSTVRSWFKFDRRALEPIGPIVVDHVAKFELQLESAGGSVFADNWDMSSLHVLYPIDPHATFPEEVSDIDLSRWQELLGVSGDPAHRFSLNEESSEVGPVWKTVKDRTVMTQGGWKSCRKCQCLVFAGLPTPGQCPADRRNHNFAGSHKYIMFAYNPLPEGIQEGRAGLQTGWRSCRRCHRMTFSGIPTINMCLAGGGHDFGGSFAYTLFTGSGVFNSKQGRWKSCSRCQGLFFADIPGACPAGGRHDPTGSWDYMVSF
ncbi:twin-arginine translocation signal domain-containing protein [Streptomyces sp. NPDC053048]|uniref:twin-arginine translocation signal domain-containing protein n=1 Tax=Streptomyces sp. NPDC053048 TaxID=3365694 RepID=UPI0037CEB634